MRLFRVLFSWLPHWIICLFLTVVAAALAVTVPYDCRKHAANEQEKAVERVGTDVQGGSMEQ